MFRYAMFQVLIVNALRAAFQLNLDHIYILMEHSNALSVK